VSRLAVGNAGPYEQADWELWYPTHATKRSRMDGAPGFDLEAKFERHTSGAKAHIHFAALAARLKSCPDTKPDDLDSPNTT
jgi:hypothetical protein